MRIHNTVADATMVNNPKVDSTIEYNHACMRVHERENEPEMANVLKKFGRATEASTMRPRQYKHDSIEPSSCKSQQGGGNKSWQGGGDKSQIYPLTVKETARAYHAHATLETLL